MNATHHPGHPPDDRADPPLSAIRERSYVVVDEDGNEALVVWDPEHPTAWLCSTEPVELG